MWDTICLVILKLSEKQSLGNTELKVPQIIYGTSYLGNLYTALPYNEKLALMKKWFECMRKWLWRSSLRSLVRKTGSAILIIRIWTQLTSGGISM